jgi:glutaminyl-peptide cyclotransferase
MRLYHILVLSTLAAIFAGCNERKIAIADYPHFDGERAMKLLNYQCDFGPRPVKSAAHDSLAKAFLAHFDSLADTSYLQYFSEFGYAGEPLPMANVIAKFNTKQTFRVLLCAHWDSRPQADRDPDTSAHKKPIIGANDGASGVAVLMHCAEIFKAKHPTIGVDIVLFDGEDYGVEGDLSRYLMGSKYFARNAGKSFWSYAVLLDMVGDSDLSIEKEMYSSMQFAPAATESIWARAKILGATAFVNRVGKAIIDDHHPLAGIGVNAVDIIDFDYPYWHTLGDTPDKCSAKSLEQIGKVMLDIVYKPF